MGRIRRDDGIIEIYSFYLEGVYGTHTGTASSLGERKQERAQRELSEQERELKRRRDEALIDRAIRKAERLQKIRKWTYIAVVVIYLAAVGLYFMLR